MLKDISFEFLHENNVTVDIFNYSVKNENALSIIILPNKTLSKYVIIKDITNYDVKWFSMEIAEIKFYGCHPGAGKII